MSAIISHVSSIYVAAGLCLIIQEFRPKFIPAKEEVYRTKAEQGLIAQVLEIQTFSGNIGYLFLFLNLPFFEETKE